MSITVRAATEADKDFIITTIIEAEKSGTDVISYCGIFGITEEQLREVLGNILEENIPGQELCIDSFLIAEEDGEYAGGLGGWIEGFDGMSSSMIKSNLLKFYIDRQVMMNAIPLMKLVGDITIEREPGVLQIESGYVVPKYRGRGVFSILTDAHIERWKERGFTFDRLHIMMMGNGSVAKHAYEKIGFVEAKSKTLDDPRIHQLLPGNTKLLMERKL